MDFTFGIITSGGNEYLIDSIINSIENQNIPNYEIIIVGQCNVARHKTKIISFDESIKPSWITKKKNLITQEASYENIVYLHDYIQFLPGWYQGQLKSKNDFKIRMDKIFNTNGQRFRDWCIWPHNDNEMDDFIERDCLLPYNIGHLSKFMYISGAYWIAKKEVMEKYPLNESLSWGQGEDVDWSLKVRQEYTFNMNEFSSVCIIKPGKERVFSEPKPWKIDILNNKEKWLN